MAFALIAIGLILIITGARDTYAALGAQLKTDFSGAHSFAAWILAIGAVGALGYVKSLQTFSTLFMTLIIVGLVLSQKGFFQQFTAQWQAGPQAVPATVNAGTSQTFLQSVAGTPAAANSDVQAQSNTVAPNAPNANAFSSFFNQFLTSPAY